MRRRLGLAVGLGSWLAMGSALGAAALGPSQLDPSLPGPGQIGSVAPAGAAGWSVVVAETPVPGVPGVTHTAWTTARPPGGVWDRIGLHRYRVAQGVDPSGPALLYLPGTHMNGELTTTDEDHDLWLFLALRGFEVFTLDYRTHAVPPDAEDLSPMAAWGGELFAADVASAADQVLAESGRRRLVVAGFSRGVFFAYAQAAAHPETTAGVIALDGFFKSCCADAAATGAEPWQVQLEGFRERGEWAVDVGGSRGWEARAELMRQAAEAPLEMVPSAEDGAAGASHGEVLAGVLYRAWGPGVLAHPREASPRGVSSARTLARLMAGYDRFYPKIQDLEGAAVVAVADHPAFTADDGWAVLRTPVLFFGSTGMGARFLSDGLCSAAHAGGPNVEIHVLEGYGHLDVLVADEARTEVFEPILDWLRRLPKDPR